MTSELRGGTELEDTAALSWAVRILFIDESPGISTPFISLKREFYLPFQPPQTVTQNKWADSWKDTGLDFQVFLSL